MYKCAICGHVYIPEEGEPSIGIAPGTPFSELPDDFFCPICGAPKEEYHPFE